MAQLTKATDTAVADRAQGNRTEGNRSSLQNAVEILYDACSHAPPRAGRRMSPVPPGRSSRLVQGCLFRSTSPRRVARAIVIGAILTLAVTGCQRRFFTPSAAPPIGATMLLCRDVDTAACGPSDPAVCGARQERAHDCLEANCPLEDYWQTFPNACDACSAAGVWKYVATACIGTGDEDG